ncbi:hypothetical protein B0I08_102208 [Glaciihabitans tibetensis]|uniref:Uncharacterized protein n=1 Tax=Glaciihabitans tibetensis TaxID=1266600 RepID=A0A2T0VH46_9MICO|nr:hypothetical protein [Glaciihabitans tibetensis]PRY69532.1 hypothetical protein B0I08_102208 [Glaciihabitans tibetensis]
MSPRHRDRQPWTAGHRTPDAVLQANERGSSLGAAHLGTGTAVLASVQVLYGLILFATHWSTYPTTAPILAAWLIYLAGFGAAVITLATVGGRLPGWSYAIYLALLAAVVALDFVAIWPMHNIGAYASVSVSAGFGLLLLLTLINARVLLVATGALAVAFVVAILANTPLNGDTVPIQLGTLTIAVLPAVVGVFTLRGFRRMVQVELDRVLVQSTVSAPRFAVGMLASEELARLDLAAEELLDDVAVGRVILPLTPDTASLAATLATELRLHLIEGRRETWLYHAVTESETLGKAVTLIDRGSLAGLLDDTQRDGLLSAVWLLVTDGVKTNSFRTLQIAIGPVATTSEPRSGNRLIVPIVVTTIGVPRNRVDPTTWESIRKIGRYRDSVQNSSLRLDIVCVVENPVDR